MNKKLKNALIIIGVVLFVALITLYVIFPNEFKYTLTLIKDFVNQPLPIVGVSLITVLIFVWRCFVASKYGKKALNELREENAKLRQENKEFKEDIETRFVGMENKISGEHEIIGKVCGLSTNQKIKNFGKELLGYGEETIDNKPKEE